MTRGSTVPRIKAVLFDLGGTLWMPFGDRRREEVLDEAAAELVQKVLHVSGKHVEVKFFIASIKDKIDGLSGGISWASCPIPAYLRRL